MKKRDVLKRMDAPQVDTANRYAKSASAPPVAVDRPSIHATLSITEDTVQAIEDAIYALRDRTAHLRTDGGLEKVAEHDRGFAAVHSVRVRCININDRLEAALSSIRALTDEIE